MVKKELGVNPKPSSDIKRI